MAYGNRIFSPGGGDLFKFEQSNIPPAAPDVFKLGMTKLQKDNYLRKATNRLCFPRLRTGQGTDFAAGRHDGDDEVDEDQDLFGFSEAARQNCFALFEDG